MLTAEDIVRSAFWRHNYNWAYWVQLMVVKGKYNSDSVPQPDVEFLAGKSPSKMMDFKEFVIRSDKSTREQFLNWSIEWMRGKETLKNKQTYGVYYWGFLKRFELSTPGKKLIDGYPGIVVFKENMMSAREKNYTEKETIPDYISHPRHPNYVACFIPHTPEEHATQIIPDLSLRTVKRHTMLQGYTESKQFYAPDYSKAKPEADKKDHRRTLLWNPNPEIGEDGRVEISFFNNASAKEIVVDINGVDDDYTYSNSPTNKKTRGDEEREIESDTVLLSIVEKMNTINPKDIALCIKLTQNGQKLYNEGKFGEAFELFNEAAEKNYPPAQFSLAMCYMNEKGTERDLKKAIYLLQSAADKGEGAAMHNMALCHLTGIAAIQSTEEAIGWYKKAANSGYALSQTALATIYHRGEIVEKNIEKALKLYKQAAEQNEPGALLALGKYYENNEKPDPKDKKAVKQRNAMVIDYVTRAADKGISEAQWFLSQCCKDGRMVKKSNKAAFRWALKAAEKGILEAQTFVGECY